MYMLEIYYFPHTLNICESKKRLFNNILHDITCHAKLQFECKTYTSLYYCLIYFSHCFFFFLASLIQSAPSAKLLQGVSELVCLAFGFSPPAINITWWLGKSEVSAHRVTKPAKGPDGKFSIRSHLDLQPSDWAPGEVYTCRVTHLADTLVLNISMKTGTLDFKY